ncbi:RidA family protein [Sedimentimonas flavescens]|uniref:RidA family protein n=1 Tax=Sedimentimonas flavescens TaxID=2851012 RepID=UPI0021A58347|nr:RidA family protein [Sedimentimonas flavescens]MCT2540344.1 RidA family protein [Sedimentimonas flavescens]
MQGGPHISNGNPKENLVGLSRAVRVGNFFAVGGTAPVGPDGNTVGADDMFLQTRQCFEIIKAGSGLQAVARTRLILTAIDNWKQAIEARKPYSLDAAPSIRS